VPGPAALRADDGSPETTRPRPEEGGLHRPNGEAATGAAPAATRRSRAPGRRWLPGRLPPHRAGLSHEVRDCGASRRRSAAPSVLGGSRRVRTASLSAPCCGPTLDGGAGRSLRGRLSAATTPRRYRDGIAGGFPAERAAPGTSAFSGIFNTRCPTLRAGRRAHRGAAPRRLAPHARSTAAKWAPPPPPVSGRRDAGGPASPA
jgi:hypothetical protein